MDGNTGKPDNIGNGADSENRQSTAERTSDALGAIGRLRARFKRSDGQTDGNGNGASNVEGASPETAAERSAEQPKTRTRAPYGSRKKARNPLDDEEIKPEFFARQIEVSHAFLAILLGTPEFALSKDEANMLAKSMLDVQTHYGVKMTKGPLLWFNLMTTALVIYMPRMAALAKRVRDKKAEQTANQRANPAPNGIILPNGPGMDFSKAA